MTTANATRARLPGKPKPAADVLREYNEANAKRRAGINPVLWDFWAPDPDGFYRWRIQLDCGHIRDVLTHGKDRLPLDGWRDEAFTGVSGRYVSVALPDGHAICTEFRCWYDNQPYRDVTEWKAREEHTYPADPEEAPDGEDPETWAARRHAEPWKLAVWEVVLSCGHIATSHTADLDWKPEDGIRYGLDPDDEDQMRRRAEILAYPGMGGNSKRRFKQMLPHPHPDEQCGFCARGHVITAYEYAGPLVPPPPKPRKAPDPKTALRRRIREAEATAAALRAELDAIGSKTER